MDMKKEEYMMELFTDDFRYYLNGHLTVKDKLLQARNAKWCNKDMQTMHMGHQPMIWLIDENHARGVFQYEDHMCYYDDCEVLQSWMVYCDDFVKGEDGAVAHPEAAHGLPRDGRQFPHHDGAPGTGRRTRGIRRTTKRSHPEKPHIPCGFSPVPLSPPHFLKGIRGECP